MAVARSRCIVLVPFFQYIEPQCERALRGLEALGYRVERSGGSAGIDRVRSELATRALAEGCDEIMWIDADMGFEPEGVDRLRAHGMPLVGGLYSRRGPRGFTCLFPSGTTSIAMGQAGGLVEVRYLATGFLLTHRRVFEDIARKFDLPVCNEALGAPSVPYFLPIVQQDAEQGWRHLSEDWSFCERALGAGYKPMVDTSIRLWHIGSYGYGWEDVAAPLVRLPSIKLNLSKG
jgi:hypothetical protein